MAQGAEGALAQGGACQMARGGPGRAEGNRF